jgi:RNA polymerase sigma-70 factor (ECF subfamily)
VIPTDERCGIIVHDAARSISSPQARTIIRQPPDLDQIIARYVDPVYRFLYRRVGNRDDAEDLTSEVFLKATRKLDRARAEVSVAAWLFTVARTVLADHWRRYYRAGTHVSLDTVDLAEMPVEFGQAERSEQMDRRVATLLDRLPDRYRQALELRFLHGYSIQETAQEMAITLQNAKVLQHRALAKALQVGEGLS